MTPIAVTVLIVSGIIIWGGLVAAILFLRSRPEVAAYPAGGDDDHREDDAPEIRDT